MMTVSNITTWASTVVHLHVFFLTTNAAVTIEWEQLTYSVREDGGLITACAQITDGELCRNLEVTAQTADLPPSPQAATSKCLRICMQQYTFVVVVSNYECEFVNTVYHSAGGDDYESNSLTKTFDENTDVMCIGVNIFDDNIPEQLFEFFSLELSSSDSAAVFPDPDVTVAIENDDSEFIPKIVSSYLGL